MIRARTLPLLAVLLLLPVLSFAAEEEPEDLVMKAMEEEMARNMARLTTDDLSLPYYMSVTVTDTETASVSAVFGAVTGRGSNKSRGLGLELRVGDHKLDDTNFSGGFGFGWGASAPTPLDDDVDSLRHAIWLVADGLFKSAHETLNQKKAWLEQNTVKDRADDFSVVPPHRYTEPVAKLSIDRDVWEKVVIELSAIFREYPAIQSSNVSFTAEATTRRFATSDGFRSLLGKTRARIGVNAYTQAEDGMYLSDQVAFTGRSVTDFPPLDEMKKKVEEMATGLTNRVSCPRSEEYIGPVLLEGPAAAELFLSLLIDQLGNPREPLGSSGWGGTVFKNRLHRRVLPEFISVHDDPRVAEYAGKPLLGSFIVDDDGVPAQKVSLVEKGRLKSWYMSRVPTRKIKETNGHSRNGIGGPGCVFVTSEKSVPEAQLLDRLRAIAKEQEMEYGIRILSLGRGGGGSLGAPIAMFKVPVDGGPQVPIRGGAFQEITLRTLRDILVTGDKEHVISATRRASIVCPSVLLEEIVLRQPGEEQPKMPVLGNPYFAK